MAGGLFGRPFALNLKCIVFSIICMSLFLYKPEFSNNYSRYITLFIIFVVAYVAMAWYDYFFNCDILPLQKGKVSFTGLFKPKAPEVTNSDLNKKRHGVLINLTHMIFVAPILFYFAYYGGNVNPMIYPIMGSLGIFTLGYHGIKLMSASH
jgi:hypothetical protein